MTPTGAAPGMAQAHRTAALPERLRAYLEAVLDILRAHHGENLLSVVLYGSTARGKLPGARDIDLLIVVEQDSRTGATARWETCQLTQPLERSPAAQDLRAQGLPADLSYALFTRRAFAGHPPLLLDMTEDGILLHDPQGVAAAELEAIRERMRQYGSRRVWLPDGSWYWILKPDIKFGERIEL